MVTFTKKKIKTAAAVTPSRSTRRKVIKKKRFFSKIFFKLIMIFLLLSTVVVVIGGFVLYNNIIKPLPPITDLKKIKIPQTSTIYNRNGIAEENILYKFYKEKRTYVGFNDIHKNMVNAIIAGEDKRFWTNPGFDLIGLTRAGLTALTTGGPIEGTSTISQQLIKNTFLTNERKVERKIKEIYLSYQMNNEFTKEKILELYLNKIEYGSNAHGIEQAAQTYFETSAKDLNFLQSAILASIPKGPTYYSPYTHPDRLMGYPYVYTGKNSSEEEQTKILTPKAKEAHISELKVFTEFIQGLQLKPLSSDTMLICGLKKDNFKGYVNVDPNGCSVLEYSELLPLLNNIKIAVGENFIEYQTGRKDFILGRMLEDSYITFEEYQQSFLDGIVFEFAQTTDKIKYPHFVFYVKEYLEEKYGKQTMEEAGLNIVTTLDPDIQEQAQAIVTKYSDINARRYGSNNAASITLDNERGEIISMVGGTDYYNKEIGGENNIITSKLQPGSTFKPFVYALAMEKNQIGPKTPVFDVKTVFPGNYAPNNFDGKFKNKMSIEEALNHSRNIPAIKMYYLAGKENAVIDFMKSLGVESYYDFKKEYRQQYGREYNFGAPMALGTGEMTPLELATAYSTIASLGKKKEISPILAVYDKNGVDVYKAERDQKRENEAISPSTAYLITSVLTNTSARPASWNEYLSLPGRKVAAKTGTSTKQFKKNGIKYIFPQNLWTVGYTPQYTTVAWTGNTDGKQLYDAGNGLQGAGPIWRDIMSVLHKQKEVKDWNRPSSIKSVVISTNSGKLPTASTPKQARVQGEFINSPTEYDDSYYSQEIDILCNGKVSEHTPPEAKKFVYGVRYKSLRPNDPAWQTPVSRLNGFGNANIKNGVCERSGDPSSMELGMSISNGGNLLEGANYVELGYRSANPVIRLDIILDGKQVASYALPSKLQGVYRGSFNVPSGLSGNKTLTVKAVDNQYYTKSISNSVVLGGKDTAAPSITVTNPARGSISLNPGDPFNLRVSISDVSPIRSTNVYLNGVALVTSSKDRSLVIPVGTAGLSPGKYTLKIDSTDIHFNTSAKSITVNILGNAPVKDDSNPTIESIPEEVAPVENVPLSEEPEF